MTIKNAFLYSILLALALTSCTGYVIEDNKVFYKSANEARGIVKRYLKSADASTFKILNNSEYAKDKSFVFYHGNLIGGADPETFEFIGDLYAKDKNRAYYSGDSIESSSSFGFRIIDSYYSADNKNIFYTTKPLNVCSVTQFKIFENSRNEAEYQRWATDGCFYYFMNFKIPSDDYKNVTYFKGSAGIAKDKRWVYMMDRIINFNDSGVKIIDTVDVATFTVSNYMDCRDKFGCINVYHGRGECE